MRPGESTVLKFPYLMGPGMGGPHRFHVVIRTNDPAQKELVFEILANSIDTKK